MTMYMDPASTGNDKLSWIHLVNPSPQELQSISQQYDVVAEDLYDLLDIDEQPRIDREETYLLIIMRIPVYQKELDQPYLTAPLGILYTANTMISICQYDSSVVSDFLQHKVRGFQLDTAGNFLLHLFMRSATYYLRYLKEINRHTAVIEQELQQSVRNNELIRLLTIQKALVFFATSLRGNETVMEKLQKPWFFKFNEDEADLLEDCLIENRQAIEMANIYSNILTGTMDAFASVISNNLNVVMKRLTSISIILMIPTLIASFYGMNVDLPLAGTPWAFAVVSGVSGLLALFGFFVFRKTKMY